AGRVAQGAVLVRDVLVVERLLLREDLGLRRLEHGVEAAQDGHRQDDVAVLAAHVEVAEHVIGDAPDEADDGAVLAGVHERERRAGSVRQGSSIRLGLHLRRIAGVAPNTSPTSSTGGAPQEGVARREGPRPRATPPRTIFLPGDGAKTLPQTDLSTGGRTKREGGRPTPGRPLGPLPGRREAHGAHMEQKRSRTMSTPVQPRWRAAMNARLFNDIERQNALSGMEKVAPQSPLMQVPAVAASYNALVTKGTTLTTSVAAVASNEKIYKSSLSARATARRAFDLEIDNLKTLVENSATSAGDVTSMGFPLFVPATTSLTAP